MGRFLGSAHGAAAYNPPLKGLGSKRCGDQAEERPTNWRGGDRARLHQASGRLRPGGVRRHPRPLHGEHRRPVPPFRRGSGKGWITSEYGMLPGSTHTRTDREATRGKQGGLRWRFNASSVGPLRAAVNLDRLGERTIRIDCDVLQADGGTRTASITGGCVALAARCAGWRRRRSRPSWRRCPWVSFAARRCSTSTTGRIRKPARHERRDDRGPGLQSRSRALRGAPFDREALSELLSLAEGGNRAVFVEQRAPSRGDGGRRGVRALDDRRGRAPVRRV